ncbi:MAG: hypothetical protein JXA18_01530 [Chitinispirillaceae bacterium]|nr:hypothetical protein [Chitinispirillaceae bacterium]
MRSATTVMLFLTFFTAMTGSIEGSSSMYLRGRVVSSSGSKAPLDSVIVRLINARRAVYSVSDGKFVLGDAVPVNRSSSGKALSPSLNLKNGTLRVIGGFPAGAVVTLFDLKGGRVGSTVYGKTGWTSQANILGGAGTRTGEVGVDGKHCSVAVLADRAYIIYFSEGGNNGGGSCLQAALLQVNNGVLTADRTSSFEFMLKYYHDPKNAGR